MRNLRTRNRRRRVQSRLRKLPRLLAAKRHWDPKGRFDFQQGIASDFDGGGGIDGWRDASETFNVTLELVKRGYTEEDIRKLWGANTLRVMGENIKRAKPKAG